MPVFLGNTSSTATGDTYEIPSHITSFSLVNRDGGGNSVYVYIVQGSTAISIYHKSMTASEIYHYDGQSIKMLAGYHIYVTATASLDYYFTIE